MKICVLGINYKGLAIAKCISNAGYEVFCTDIEINKNEIEKLIEIQEELAKQNSELCFDLKNIKFAASCLDIIKSAELIFIAVETFITNGEIYISKIENVIDYIAKLNSSPKTIVLNSILPIGTNIKFKSYIKENCHIDFMSMPIILSKYNAENNFYNQKYIICGTDSEVNNKKIINILRNIVNKECKFIFCNSVTAEWIVLCKYAFYTMQSAFVNEMAMLADKSGYDTKILEEVFENNSNMIECLNNRLGFYGDLSQGSLDIIVSNGQKKHLQMNLCKAILQSNDNYFQYVSQKIEYICDGLKNRKITVWGITNKEYDEHIILKYIHMFLTSGATINIYDSQIREIEQIASLRNYKKKINIYTQKYEALSESQLLIIFIKDADEIDVRKIKEKMKIPRILDIFGLWNEYNLKENELGIEYYTI